MILGMLNLVSVFGVFAAVCVRLYGASRPKCMKSRYWVQWVMWLAVHLGIGFPMVVMAVDQLVFHNTPSPQSVLLRVSLAVMLLWPWNRREQDR